MSGEFISHIPELRRKMDRARKDGLFAGGSYLLEESNRTIPIEEAKMEQSGSVMVEGSTARVGYNTPYARRQHEDTTLRHDPGRRSKWLKLTFIERGRTAFEVVGRVMKARVH